MRFVSCVERVLCRPRRGPLTFRHPMPRAGKEVLILNLSFIHDRFTTRPLSLHTGHALGKGETA